MLDDGAPTDALAGDEPAELDRARERLAALGALPRSAASAPKACPPW